MPSQGEKAMKEPKTLFNIPELRQVKCPAEGEKAKNNKQQQEKRESRPKHVQ